MSVEVEIREGVAVVTPQGPRLTVENHQEMHEAFAKVNEGDYADVIVNLFLVDLIDSMGLGSLVAGRLKIRSKPRIHLCGLNNLLAKTITMSRLDLVFPVHENLVEALNVIQSGAGPGEEPAGT